MRFLLLDRIVLLEPGRRAAGTKQFSVDEDFFADHFPGYPVVPGVLLVEALAQLGGRLVMASLPERESTERMPMLVSIERAEFRRPVRPAEGVDLTAELNRLNARGAKITGQATVAGILVASTELTYGLVRLDEAAERGGLSVDRLRQWSADVWREILPESSGWRPPGARG